MSDEVEISDPAATGGEAATRDEAAPAASDPRQLVGDRAPLPIVVRRAVPGDGDAVLSFTRGTFDGWDYVPLVWAHWLVASDGVLLVATPGVPGADGSL
jgi:hypothetical protein